MASFSRQFPKSKRRYCQYARCSFPGALFLMPQYPSQGLGGARYSPNFCSISTSLSISAFTSTMTFDVAVCLALISSPVCPHLPIISSMSLNCSILAHSASIFFESADQKNPAHSRTAWPPAHTRQAGQNEGTQRTVF